MSLLNRPGDGGGTPPRSTKPKSRFKAHVNNLWSIWYGLSVTALQTYIAVQSGKRLLDYLDLPWGGEGAPRGEFEACLVLTGLGVVGLPVFLLASLCKVGNLPNDGYKLGRHLGSCEADPLSPATASAGLAALWRHGGPTAPFIHIATAFCLLLPKLLIQAKLIQADFLPKQNVWKTDLDFIVSSYDRLVVLSFMTPSTQDMNNTWRVTVIPPMLSTPASSHTMALTSNQEIILNDEEKWGPVSIEFFNYALALAVYAVRYPAVFWNTNKCWGAIFSFQLFVNGIQNLLMYVGVCVLYKVHVIGPSEVLTTLPVRFGDNYFLLNPHVTLALFVLTTALVLSSSLVLYLYGYGRFNAFLSHEKACKVISVEGREWGYLTHCAALCVLLAITVVEGPLLVDLAVIYKSSLDSAVLFSVVTAVFHLFIWVVLWLGLTLKQNWVFKLRVTVGKAAVKSARSIKLLTDVELVSTCESSAPLLVVASGRTYTVCDTSPKKTIIAAIHKAALERKAKLQGTNNSTKERVEDSEEQIYWLRPKPLSPKNSPDSEVSDRVSWYQKPTVKPKVTFDQTAKGGSKDVSLPDDDGDYARLRELPLLGSSPIPQHDPKKTEDDKPLSQNEGKTLLVAVSRDYEDPSPLLTPEPQELPQPTSNSDTPTTPRCLRRADSGMPHDLTPRSDSETSGSPPDHSETSSGVHSNSSRESNNTGVPKRSTSVEDITVKQNRQWKSSSLQRGVNLPPETGEVVIRRRDPEVVPVTGHSQEPFGRSTNMRMTSFTDNQSATLPHFPTQQIGVPYPHCSTMPLPPPALPPITHTPSNYPRHTTIPTHHNGVRLFTPNPYAKRPIVHRYAQHHSFPQLMNPIKYNLRHNSERDSANFSMASSGDSDAYHS